MKYIRFIYIIATAGILFTSCNKDVLDRPPLTQYLDENYWRNEEDVRLYANGFYPNYFVGYNTSFTVDYTPVRGYTFSDDLTSKNVQSAFESSVPTSRSSTSEAGEWLAQYSGPNWNFSWVRKSNIFIDRLENVAKPNLSEEAYKHWMGVARFFRGFEYSRLVSVFGDVPYLDKVYDTNNPEDIALMYKDRDDRSLVMDKVYDDFKYALTNIRENDGAQFLNRNIAAAFVSRLMLFEGTFLHYHNLDAVRAKKYLEFAMEASEIVMNSNKFNFSKDFKTLFSSESLAGHPEVIMYRVYDASQGVTHSIGSYSNGTEVKAADANLVLIKSFIISDGNVWQNSAVPGVNTFTISDLVRTRDPRFEASFFDKALTSSSTLLYGDKFASREALTYIGKTYPPAWGSNTNTSDAPIIRLAEVVLNWVEAKAVLAEYFGGAAVTQADLDKSVNAIRNRPLDAAAIAKGVQKTVPLTLASLPNDPVRDADVPALIWEIRRERRMEFVFEHTRLLDLKRWKKLNYMNFGTNQDYFLGPWVNVQVEVPAVLTTGNIGKIRVKKADNSIVTYNGSNANSLIGYWMVENASNRNAFTDRSYMAPVGAAQINQYLEKGYKLTQTDNW